MRRIASASAGATDRTVSLSWCSLPCTGTVLVQTISLTSGSPAIFSSAPLLNSAWVQAMRTEGTPCSRRRASSSTRVVPRAISSSSTITSRPSTSPMIEEIATCSSLMRCLAPRSEEHTSELQSRRDLVCRLLLEKKKKKNRRHIITHKEQKKKLQQN